jgi:hypothetical protein
LVEVDDDSYQENDHQSCGKVVVLLPEVPEENAEDQEDVERLDDLKDEQLDNGRFMDHHSSRSVCILQMKSIGLFIALLFLLFIGELPDPIRIVVYAQSDSLVPFHQVCHVPVGKTYRFGFDPVS